MTDNVMWRVAVRCQRCGEHYLTRAKQEKKPPARCKECKSSLIDVDSNIKEEYRYKKVTDIP